jgi:hypothetical protein
MDSIEVKFADKIKEGNLNKSTVAEMKEFLTVKGLPNKGNKVFMIELIEEYFETHFNIS